MPVHAPPEREPLLSLLGDTLQPPSPQMGRSPPPGFPVFLERGRTCQEQRGGKTATAAGAST